VRVCRYRRWFFDNGAALHLSEKEVVVGVGEAELERADAAEEGMRALNEETVGVFG